MSSIHTSLAVLLALALASTTWGQGRTVPPDRERQEIAAELERVKRSEVAERRGRLSELVERILRLPKSPDQVRLLLHAADQYRDIGSYRAESLYRQAVRRAPDDPYALHAIGRYFRLFRGAKGLYSEAQRYYTRAEEVVEARLREEEEKLSVDVIENDADRQASIAELRHLREVIRRGQIELQKREGYSLGRPFGGDGFSISYQTDATAGSAFPGHNDLATPARAILKVDPAFDPRLLLREREIVRHEHTLRVRAGSWPWLDVFWTGIADDEAIASQTSPPTFSDVDVSDGGVALEDDVRLGPLGDLLWRLEYRKTKLDIVGMPDEDIERWTTRLVWTRNFGRVKSDLELIGSVADVELPGGAEDLDDLWAANLTLLFFPQQRRYDDQIDVRGYELGMGFVRNVRTFGPNVDLVRDTYFTSAEIRDVLPRTDVRLVENFFDTQVEGSPNEDSSSLESNLILTHRLVDRVNKIRVGDSERAVGLAQWALVLRGFDDQALGDLKQFESRGGRFGTFVELYSGPARRSTAILEVAYEYRDYYELSEEESVIMFTLKLGIGNS